MSFQTVTKPPLASIAPIKSRHDILSLFAAHNIQYVRIQWVDYLNQVRFRVLPISYFRKLLASERPGVLVAKAVFAIVVLQLAPGFSGVGEYIYVFDPSSVRTCHYAPRHAVLFGFFQEQTAVPRPNGPSFEVLLCPRTVLSRLLKYAAEELGVQFLVGCEIEFSLLRSTNPIVAVNDCQYSTALGLMTGTVEAQVMEEIADAIQADGIELQMYHREAAPGQYEISTGPLAPLEAADALVHTRETIYSIARKYGLRATFAPRLASDSCGTGAHMHVSVHGQKQGLPTPPFEFLTPVESAFLSGLMQHLPSVIAFTMPLHASYARMQDGIWSGGTWVCWGAEQRDAPVRLTNMTSPSSRNFEVRPVDGTSCPHLAVAGVLACGILGVRDNLELAVQNCNSPKSVAQMSDEERGALGITRRFPLDIEEARRHLASADAIKEILGDGVIDLFVQVNQMLEKVYDRREEETEPQALQRLVENY